MNLPEGIDGIPFLGKEVSSKELGQRDVAYGYADRFDEKYDLVRTVRKGRLKYMRNYQPFNFDGLQNNYRYKCLAYRAMEGDVFTGGIERRYRPGSLNPGSRRRFMTLKLIPMKPGTWQGSGLCRAFEGDEKPAQRVGQRDARSQFLP